MRPFLLNSCCGLHILLVGFFFRQTPVEKELIKEKPQQQTSEEFRILCRPGSAKIHHLARVFYFISVLI